MDWLWVLITLARQISPDPDDQWASRLAALDSVRGRAFAAAEPELLGDVYLAGSPAMASDASIIKAYARRDARVTGAELRILSCVVMSSSRDRVRLDVVDVVGRAEVQWSDGTSTALPRDEPSERIVTLQRTPDGWRIASLQDVG